MQALNAFFTQEVILLTPCEVLEQKLVERETTAASLSRKKKITLHHVAQKSLVVFFFFLLMQGEGRVKIALNWGRGGEGGAAEQGAKQRGGETRFPHV